MCFSKVYATKGRESSSRSSCSISSLLRTSEGVSVRTSVDQRQSGDIAPNVSLIFSFSSPSLFTSHSLFIVTHQFHSLSSHRTLACITVLSWRSDGGSGCRRAVSSVGEVFAEVAQFSRQFVHHLLEDHRVHVLACKTIMVKFAKVL